MQNSFGLLDSQPAAVEGESHPGCQGLMICNDGIIVLAPEPYSEPAIVLSLPTARNNRVDVHGIDLAREPGASRMVSGCPFGKQHNHDRIAVVLMGTENHACTGCCEACIEPEITNSHRIMGFKGVVVCELTRRVHFAAGRLWRRLVCSW